MKYCPKCAHSNEDTVQYCGNCGTFLGEAQSAPEAPIPPVESVAEPVAPEAPAAEATPVVEAAPLSGSYTTDYNNAYNTTEAGQIPAAPVSNTATLWLILNIVLTVLCCGNVVNIVGIIFAALGMSAFNKGDYTQMASQVKISKILFFVGLGLGLLFAVIMIITAVAGGLSSFGDFEYGY